MEVEHLREYLSVCEELNLTTAAKKLCTTQSTLSKHLTALEKEVGAQLIKRNSRMMELTPAGVEFGNCARLMCAIYDESMGRIAELKHRPNVTISGMLQNRDVVSTLSQAARLLSEQGGRNLAMTPMLALPFRKNLLDRKVDMALCYASPEAQKAEGLCCIPLLREQFVAYMGPNCPVSDRRRLSIDDLRDVTFIRLVSEYSTNGWETIVNVCERHGFTPQYRTIPVNDPIDFIMSDLGDAVLIMQRDVLSAQQASLLGFSESEIIDEDAYFTIGLFYREEDELSAYIEALCAAAESVQTSIENQYRASSWYRLENGCKVVSQQASLNESESEVLKEFVMGHTLEHIGDKLGLSRIIVGDLVVSAYRKLGVRNRQEMLDLLESQG